MKAYYFLIVFFCPFSVLAQEDIIIFDHSNQLAKTEETIKQSSNVDLSTLALLPFLNDNVKKLEKLITEKDNLLREKDAEILRLIRLNNQVAIEKKECEVDLKHCRAGNYLQLGISGLATIASFNTGAKCVP